MLKLAKIDIFFYLIVYYFYILKAKILIRQAKNRFNNSSWEYALACYKQNAKTNCDDCFQYTCPANKKALINYSEYVYNSLKNIKKI